MNTTDDEKYLENKNDGMIHAIWWFLIITCYLLLAICYLPPVTCYLLLAICYLLLTDTCNLILSIWSLGIGNLLFLAKELLPFAPVVRLALVFIRTSRNLVKLRRFLSFLRGCWMFLWSISPKSTHNKTRKIDYLDRLNLRLETGNTQNWFIKNWLKTQSSYIPKSFPSVTSLAF